MHIKTKRWNDPVEADDGYRLLVCRYRPRGWSASLPREAGETITLLCSSAYRSETAATARSSGSRSSARARVRRSRSE